MVSDSNSASIERESTRTFTHLQARLYAKMHVEAEGPTTKLTS